MLSSRTPRNRYRRRPSRLTGLGKAVVASTLFGLFALGWAGQASHREPELTGTDRADQPAVGEAVDRSAASPRPVSAPPRWPGPPRFGALAAPEPGQTVEVGADEAPAAPVPPPASPALDAQAADPAAAMASATSPIATERIAGKNLTPPTSRARFEAARGGRPARTAPPALVASLAENPERARPMRALDSHRRAIGRSLSEWVDADALASFQGARAMEGSTLDGAFAARSGERRLRVEYSLDEQLTGDVFEILRQGRVERGIAIVIEPKTGRLLAYATTNPDQLPVERAYPAASIVKVVTAAAMLERRPNPGAWDCVYEGNKYRLTERRLDPPARGNHSTLEQAMATSNNQCFSQWAIHGLGESRLRRMLDLVGWSAVPAAGHARGHVEPAATRFDLGQLGSGLDGVRVTALHVASLASVLADGRLVEPRWIDAVRDEDDRPIELARPAPAQRVIGPRTAASLRELMVATTRQGTARRAFRTRRGVPALGSIEVAGKTGNLNGTDPKGRYEWFFGVAPAHDPKIGVVVLQVHGHLWWARSSELAANILKKVFCEGSACRSELASRFTGPLDADPEQVLASRHARRRAPGLAD